MANWSSPVLTDLYTNVMSYLKDRDDDAIRLNDTRSASASNLPDNAKRWNNTLGTFQNWLSSVWADIVLAIAGGGTGATTASGARTNLGVPSVSEASATAQGLVDTHNAVANPHGAVSAATANKLILRDSAGNAKVAYPGAPEDIATASYAYDIANDRVANHQSILYAHSAVSTPTASRIVLRDSAGRSQVASPSVSGDIATKGYVDGLLASGLYAPTLTIGVNLDVLNCSADSQRYVRIGNVVTVSGEINVSATASGNCTFYATLPIASDPTQTYHLSGILHGHHSSSPVRGSIYADTANNRAYFLLSGADPAVTYTIQYEYTYQVM
jgi:hypothetical protein